MSRQQVQAFFDATARQRDRWKARNAYYYAAITRLCRGLVPPGATVLELGCSTGDLLHAVRPRFGVGLDLSARTLEVARNKYPQYHFVAGDAEAPPLGMRFDYVLMSDLLGYLEDVWGALQSLGPILGRDARLLLTFYNPLWRPALALGEKLGLRMPYGTENWLTPADVRGQLYLADLEVETQGSILLLPRAVPLLTRWANDRVAQRAWAHPLCMVHYVLARPAAHPSTAQDLTCTVVVPCRNEVGNVRDSVRRIPEMGSHTEIIFVDGASTDGTPQLVESLISEVQGHRDVKLIHQPIGAGGRPLGKGDAVRRGFAAAQGDVVMILDADLTVPPEDLPKFFWPLAQDKADLVNGTRLIYPMEDEAMKTLNHFGNVFFSLVFSWLLGQRISDTLCGTKAMRRRDGLEIMAQREHLSTLDLFGDFDWLFGAARLGLRIVEVPVRYRRRVAGLSKIRVLKHGWLFLRMCWVGIRKFKLEPLLKRERRGMVAHREPTR